MLKNIHPLLNADLLHVLQSMGHGDELVLADCNFPAHSIAERLVRLDGADVIGAAEAILSVFPLDSFVEHPVHRMEVVGQPAEIPEVQRAVQTKIDASAGRALPMAAIERHAFYQRSRQAYAVVATGDRRGYGCFILTKGVIGLDGEVVW